MKINRCSLQQAINAVRALLEPAVRFTSGTKIYEPADDDPQASLKREIIKFAVGTVRLFENELPSGKPTAIATRQSEANAYRERLESNTSVSEKQEYFKLLAAVDEIIAAGIGKN